MMPEKPQKMMLPYNLLYVLVAAVALPVALPAAILSEKFRKTALHRLGFGSFEKLGKKPVWVHALSVGETLSAVPLVTELKARFPDTAVVFSVSTLTGWEIAKTKLEGTADALFYYPYDFVFSVKRVLNRVDPSVVVLVETDIWPNFLSEANARNIPVSLINARISERSFKGYRKFSFFTKPLFSVFSQVCCQTSEDARKFSELGVRADAVSVTGNLKFDQPEEIGEEDVRALRNILKTGPDKKIIVAGSTHKGEEIIVRDVFLRLKTRHKNMLLILAPRDPNRAGRVGRLFQDAGMSPISFTEIKNGIKTDIVIVDMIGVLKKLYAIADIAFVGGSLMDFGGHNPLEPAIFFKPVIFGPHMSDFKQISALLLQAGGAVRVHDPDTLFNALDEFLSDTEKCEKTGNNAFGVFHANKGAVEKTVCKIGEIICP